jgi:hypothetical protein
LETVGPVLGRFARIDITVTMVRLGRCRILDRKTCSFEKFWIDVWTRKWLAVVERTISGKRTVDEEGDNDYQTHTPNSKQVGRSETSCVGLQEGRSRSGRNHHE